MFSGAASALEDEEIGLFVCFGGRMVLMER
jgi:hypothetical protein